MSEPRAERPHAPSAVRALRAGAGLCVSSLWAVAEIAGPDRVSFLDSQLPQDFQHLEPGRAHDTAYLDRKGRLTSFLVVLNLGDVLWALIPSECLAATLTTLESFHFRERVEIRPRPDLALLELHGPAVPAVLGALGHRIDPAPLRHAEFLLQGHPVRFLSFPWTGDVGGCLVAARDDVHDVREALLAAGAAEGLIEVPEDALEILRVEGGRPRLGQDVDEHTLLLELGREEMVSHTKGCYLGQETVARVHARGHVNRLLMGVEIEGDAVPAPGTLLVRGDAPVGETRSALHSPSLGRVLALAMMRREAAEPGTVVHWKEGARAIAARVVELPFYRPRGPRDEAERLYREGMEAFKKDDLEGALARFERATFMNPHHGLAFEAMGVCQERLGRLAAAIQTMESLVEMEPDNTMAWTNLSRYRAAEGRIEEAERLKGHVTYLLWKKEAGEKAAVRRQEEDSARRRVELEERVGLFRQVLDLDPEDVVANFGLGKILFDLDRFEEAVPCFERAIAHQKDYSQAFNLLGTCLARSGRMPEAAAVFRAGIEAATRRGDLMPKRDMMRKLEELDAS